MIANLCSGSRFIEPLPVAKTTMCKRVLRIVWPMILLIFVAGCRDGYRVQGDQVVFSRLSGNGRSLTGIPGAHAESFVQLADSDYGKDRSRVYWLGMVINGANPESFECLADLYSRDRDHVFWRENLIVGADPKTFVILNGEELWSRDARDIFYGDQPIGVKSPDNFRVLNDSWATDGVSYYYVQQFAPKGILRSDYKSTKLLNDSYAVDREHAYYRTQSIPGADPATFKPLNECYAVDANRAYFEAAPVAGADVATFELGVHYHTAKDRYRTYAFGKAK
jgi:hypothetical protein